MGPLSLAYSPCPNDTYIFHAWVAGLVPGAPEVREVLSDIHTLNEEALRGGPDVTKVSFHAYAHVRDAYSLLHSGGALGRGCGPLLVARPDSTLAGLAPAELSAALAAEQVAIPGPLTTAALLLRLFAPGLRQTVAMQFDRIMPAVQAGEVAVGAIIHESRFTYPDYGLVSLMDLGDWWESTTGRTIPLGAIAIRRDLGRQAAAEVDRAIRASIEVANSDPDASADYVRRHAQEMDPAVCAEHIALYVNEYSLDYGPEGEEAIRYLLRTAQEHNIVPASEAPLFWDD